MKKIFLLLIICVCLANIPAVFSQDLHDEVLVYMTEDYPPFNYLEKGKLKGIAVDLLKMMWKKMEYPEHPIKVYPWARGYMLVQERKNHVLFATSRTAKREKLFKWVGPIHKTRRILLGLSTSKIKLSSLEDAKKYEIGTVRNDVGEDSLSKAGFDINKLQRVDRLETNMKKLIKGRVDFICQSEIAIKNIITLNNYDAKQFKTFLNIDETQVYYAFHKDTSNLLIQKFQIAFNSLKDQHQEILKRYGLDHTT